MYRGAGFADKQTLHRRRDTATAAVVIPQPPAAVHEGVFRSIDDGRSPATSMKPAPSRISMRGAAAAAKRADDFIDALATLG